jgi:hypothetical protein
MSEHAEKIRRFLDEARAFGCKRPHDGSQQDEDMEALILGADSSRVALDALVAELEEVRHERDVLESGAMDCVTCGRLTGNGECTECRRGVSPFKKLQAENERLRALLKDTNESLIEACASETRLQADRRALAERVREALKVKAKAHACVGLCSCRHIIATDLGALDLEPLLTPEEP